MSRRMIPELNLDPQYGERMAGPSVPMMVERRVELDMGISAAVALMEWMDALDGAVADERRKALERRYQVLSQWEEAGGAAPAGVWYVERVPYREVAVPVVPPPPFVPPVRVPVVVPPPGPPAFPKPNTVGLEVQPTIAAKRARVLPPRKVMVTREVCGRFLECFREAGYMLFGGATALAKRVGASVAYLHKIREMDGISVELIARLGAGMGVRKEWIETGVAPKWEESGPVLYVGTRDNAWPADIAKPVGAGVRTVEVIVAELADARKELTAARVRVKTLNAEYRGMGR